MRKKINSADQYFIENHCETMTAEEISNLIDLEYDAVFNYFDVAKVAAKTKRREESKGTTVLTVGDAERGDDVVKVATPQRSPDYIWRG
jgi:hypothetical protein